MTQHEAKNILRRMYRILNHREDIRIKLATEIPEHGTVNFYCDKPAVIQLNPNRRGAGGIVSTLIHELLHIVFYDDPEYKICEKEKQMYRLLSDRQLTNLLRKTFS